MNIEDILKYINQLGSKVLGNAIEPLFILIIMIEENRIPFWGWAVVTAALVYFVSPIDAMPDPILLDDANVLAAAVAFLGSAVTPEVRAKARARINAIFGNVF